MESTPKNIPDLKTTLKICGILAVITLIFIFVIPYCFPELGIFIENFIFAEELFLLFLLFKIIKKSGYDLSKTLYLNRIQKNMIAPILIISVSVILFENGFMTYLQHFSDWPTLGDAPVLELSPYWYYNISIIVGACVTAPILEEMLFRGLILSVFSERFGPAMAIIITSLVFSGLHFIPSFIASLFIGSLIVGWMVFKTNSIICGIIAHCLNNTVAMFEVMLAGNNNIKMIIDLNQTKDFVLYAAYLFIGMVGAIIGIAWLNRKINSSEILAQPR